jgi:hypothetical protein
MGKIHFMHGLLCVLVTPGAPTASAYVGRQQF